MECKHTYYKMVDGGLVCSVCGRPAHASTIEDKIGPRPENKKQKKVKI